VRSGGGDRPRGPCETDAQEEERLAASRPVEPEAYQLYLKGRHEWNKFTPSSLRTALEHFHKALDHDPGYAPAYLGIADAYYSLAGNYMSPQVAYPKARAAARRAIELDESLAEAHATLGNVAMGHLHDWRGAEAAFHRALELNPSHAMAHNSYGVFLSFLGRTEEAIEQMDRAQELDPLSPYIAVGAAWPYLYAFPEKRNYRRAIEVLEAVVETDPAFLNAHVNLAIAHSLLRQCDSARQEIDKSIALSGGDTGIVVWLGSVHATCGDRARANEILAGAWKGDAPGKEFPFFVALIYASLGETENALRSLELAVENGDDLLISLVTEPRLDGLRADPRFIDLLRRLGLPAQ
jgi:Tfp pilus assembly protein PilF